MEPNASRTSVTANLVYDIRFVAEVREVDGGLRINFRDGATAFLEASHPHFQVLRLHAEWNQGRPVAIGAVLDADGRIVDLNTAHDTTVQAVQECPEDCNRLKVAFLGYSPVCYLTRDHPEFNRLRSILTKAAGTSTVVWVANRSEMVESEPTTDDGEFEVWWKIMDVRPAME
jgi:hypothetical protein